MKRLNLLSHEMSAISTFFVILAHFLIIITCCEIKDIYKSFQISQFVFSKEICLK